MGNRRMSGVFCCECANELPWFFGCAVTPRLIADNIIPPVRCKACKREARRRSIAENILPCPTCGEPRFVVRSGLVCINGDSKADGYGADSVEKFFPERVITQAKWGDQRKAIARAFAESPAPPPNEREGADGQ